MKKRKKSSTILLILLLLVGLALIFNQQIKDAIVKFNTQNRMSQVTKDKIANAHKVKGSYDFAAVRSIGAGEVAQASTDNTQGYLGKIAIPAVGLKLPIVKGVSKTALAIGAGTLKPDEKMGQGNYALAGHNMINPGILFSPVVQTKAGQKIYVTDLSHVYTYQIDSKKVIEPTNVSTIDDVSGKQLITLITCTDSGKQRWAVQGHLIDTKKATKATLAVF